MKAKTLRRIYLREATVMLVAARLAVRFVPAAQLFAWASRPPERIYRFAADEVDRVSWAIEMISSKQWMNTSALPRALAAHAMLRGGELAVVSVSALLTNAEGSSHTPGLNWVTR